MKRANFLILTAFLTFLTQFSFAKKAVQVASDEPDFYEYNNLVSTVREVKPPQITDKYIVFTHELNARFVGIAFDYENYTKIHKFQKRINTDLDDNITSSLLFFVLERTRKTEKFKYRLIVDGLWTTDPENPNVKYDEKTGISFSCIDTIIPLPTVTIAEKKESVRFIYKGKSGQTVRLAGSFTNWDSWIYELTETMPGFYEIAIPLPEGRYYYNYYIGMQELVDRTNPERAYTAEGRESSVIVVE